MRIDEIKYIDKKAKIKQVIKKYFPKVVFNQGVAGYLGHNWITSEDRWVFTITCSSAMYCHLAIQTSNPNYEEIFKYINIIKEVPYIKTFRYRQGYFATREVSRKLVLIEMKERFNRELFCAADKIMIERYGKAGIEKLTDDDIKVLRQSIMQQIKDEIGYAD